MPTRPLNPSTERLYSSILKSTFGGIEHFIGGASIDAAKMTEWKEGRRNTLRAAIRRKGADLGIAKRQIEALIEKIPVKWEPRREVVVPSEDEMKLYEKAARKLPDGKRALALLPLALGLRASEVLSLSQTAVQRAHDYGELLVMRKGAHEQSLPAEHAKKLFRELLDTRRANARPALNAAPDFSELRRSWATTGEILSRSNERTQYHLYYEMVKRTGEAAGISGLRPHKLRHAFATRMMRDGAPIPAVQWALGHSRIETTLLYVHPTAADAAKYLRPFNR